MAKMKCFISKLFCLQKSWFSAIVVVLVVLLFGRGKISSLMGDVAKGIKSFKKGMKDPTEDQSESTSSQDQSSEEENSDKK